MSAQDGSDFDILKRMLLQHISLTSEGNWKRFREAKKGRDESYYKFTARLTGYVKRSIELSGNDKTFEALLDMLVREYIYEISDRSLSNFLRERNPENVDELVALAEQYRIAHSKQAKDHVVHARGKDRAHQDKAAAKTSGSRDKQACYACGKSRHLAWKCPDRRGSHPKSADRDISDRRKPPMSACIVGVCPEGASVTKHSVDPDEETAKLVCGQCYMQGALWARICRNVLGCSMGRKV